MSKYIVTFDLETTGLDKNKDQIIQFAGIKIDPTTNKAIENLNLYIQPFGSYTIGIGAYLKHGIKPDFLKDKPYFKDIATQIIDFIDDCDIVTYNGTSFDIPFLINELSKYGYTIDFMHRKCYDAFLEEKRRNGINLENTYKRYSGKTMEEAGLSAHDALSDVKATYSVFYAQQRKQNYGPEEMLCEDGVIKSMDFYGENKPCFTIGKYKEASVEYVAKFDKGYLNWAISDKCGFSKSTKEFIKQYL